MGDICIAPKGSALGRVIWIKGTLLNLDNTGNVRLKFKCLMKEKQEYRFNYWGQQANYPHYKIHFRTILKISDSAGILWRMTLFHTTSKKISARLRRETRISHDKKIFSYFLDKKLAQVFTSKEKLTEWNTFLESIQQTYTRTVHLVKLKRIGLAK